MLFRSKPANGMLTMKHDKTGACTVLAVMDTVQRLAPGTPLLTVDRPGVCVLRLIGDVNAQLLRQPAPGVMIARGAVSARRSENRHHCPRYERGSVTSQHPPEANCGADVQ